MRNFILGICAAALLSGVVVSEASAFSIDWRFRQKPIIYRQSSRGHVVGNTVRRVYWGRSANARRR